MITEQIWAAFNVPLRKFICQHVSDDAAAEDLLQEIFLKIHQYVETLKDVTKLESWVYQITQGL